jgi:hypothetical protein
MATMALITAANVVTRYLTNISLAFTEEFSCPHGHRHTLRNRTGNGDEQTY